MTNQAIKIYKRTIIDKITPFLGDNSIIVLHGARQVGKTHIMYYLQQHLEKENNICKYIDLEDDRILTIFNEGVDSFVNYLNSLGYLVNNDVKKTYIFIDEIQYLDNPSSFLKLIADHHKEIQLIVSGSSSFEIKSKFKDSLVGRTINFEIFNLSFEEFLVFKNLDYNLNMELPSPPILESIKKEYNEYMLFGGYPQIVMEPDILKKETKIQQIIQTYIQKDIKDLANINDTKKFNQLLKVLANQNGQLLNITELASLTAISKVTIEKYLFILENTYILKILPVFSKNPKIEVSKAPKLFFYDTGIVQLLANKELTQSSKGNLFENSVFVELVKMYSQTDLYFWRSKNGSEIDFILNYKNKIIPIEVKLNFEQFRPTIVNGFLEKYQCPNYYIAGLDGKLNKNCIYPWYLKTIANN